MVLAGVTGDGTITRIMEAGGCQSNRTRMSPQNPLTKDDGRSEDLVLEVASEGGSIKIRRTRVAGGDWRFTVIRDESALADLLDEEDQQGLSFSDESESVDSIEAALVLMNDHPWHLLVPLRLHVDYASAIMDEVVRRGGPRDGRRWQSALARRSAHREPPA